MTSELTMISELTLASLLTMTFELTMTSELTITFELTITSELTTAYVLTTSSRRHEPRKGNYYNTSQPAIWLKCLMMVVLPTKVARYLY